MTTATKAPFAFPLLAGDIAEFCHPSPASPLHLAHFHDGELTAGNGHIAIRAARGRWMASDFTPPPPEFTKRLASLPWHRFPAPSPEWRALDDIRGAIYAHAAIAPWTGSRHSPTPCPVWRIGGHHRIRLSHLQLLARLPRAEIYAGTAREPDPIFIRYNGGTAILPHNHALNSHSRDIFAPQYHPLDGYRIERSANARPSFSNHLKNWPPPTPTDD